MGMAGAGMVIPEALHAVGAEKKRFALNYILGSCMYGYMDLEEIVKQVGKAGCKSIDIWPKVHGNQREQLEEMGEEKFRKLLKKHSVKLGCITQYKLGPFGLQDEMILCGRLGCQLIVTGGKGEKGLTGTALKSEVRSFAEKMKPHLEVAEEQGVKIAIENHGNNLIESPDSLKWLLEFRSSENLGIALAPYHLEQDPEMLSELIRDLAPGLFMFYGWQHGMGCMEKLPKEQELLQLPGRGDLDFKPLLLALRDIKYKGFTEIFMHPVPRGVPILDTSAEVTEEINRGREYFEKCLS